MIHKINPRSLLSQLILGGLSVQILILGLVLWQNWRIFEQQIEKDLKLQALTVEPLLNAALSPLVLQRDDAAIQTLLGSLNKTNLSFLDIYDDSGQRLSGFNSKESNFDAASLTPIPDHIVEIQHTLRLDGKAVGQVRLGLFAHPLSNGHVYILEQNLKVMVPAILLTVAMMSLISYSMISRIKTLLHQTQAAIAGTERITVEESGNDELSQLMRALNQMHETLRERTRALQTSERRFRDFANAGTDWLWELDAELHIVWLSENFEQATGLQREKVYGEFAYSYYDENNLANSDYQRYVDALQQRIPFKNMQISRMTGQGSKWRRLSGIPVFNEKDEFQGYRGITADITELRKLRQDTEQQQQRFIEAVELFDGLFVLFDVNDCLLMWNRKYHKVLEEQGIGHLAQTGVSFETLINAQVERGIITDAIGRERQWRQWRLAQFRHPEKAFDLRVSGQWFHVRQQRLPDGTLLMAQFDIRESKQAEQILLQAKQEAERAAAMKSQFLITASHDLRQPLQALRILKDVLAMRFTDDAELEQILSSYETALTAMEQLLRGYLDVGRLESGTVSPELENFPVQELLQSVYDQFSGQAGGKKLRFRLVPCSAVIYSDRTLLGQILRNLVSNAIRYTQTGKVLIGCRRHGDHLSLQVWDTGPGIPEDQQHKIFDDFYQINNKARNHNEGYGIGLTIINRIVHLLGYKIHMTSQPGKGTRFAVEVPLGELSGAVSAATNTHAANANVRATGKTILVIEDDSAIQHSLTLLLRQNGFQVTACDNGEQALQHLTGNAPPPWRVITDFWLSGQYTGLKWLKTLQRVLPEDTGVIVITGDTSPGTYYSIEAIGCMLQTKPIQTQKLLTLLRAERALTKNELAERIRHA